MTFSKIKTICGAIASVVLLALPASAGSIFLAGDSNIFTTNADNDVFFQNVFNGQSVVNFSGRTLSGLGTTAVEDSQGTSATITSSLLAGNDFAIFGWNRTSVSASEIAALDAFHDAGGSLFLFGEGATAFNALNGAVNSILSALGSSMSLSLSASDNFKDGGFTTFSVTGATPFATGVNSWETAFASGINLGSGTAVISGDAGSGFGTAVAVEGLTSAPAIPVPGGLPLAASGLIALGWLRRKQKS